MITPAVLISACGTLVFSTSSRLSRVVDRVRVLVEMIEQLSASSIILTSDRVAQKRSLILDQLSRLSRRVLLLRSAMTSFYVAIGLFVATSIVIGVLVVVEFRAGMLPVILGLAGAAVLLYGSVLLIAEARLAVTSTLNELTYVKEIVGAKKMEHEIHA